MQSVTCKNYTNLKSLLYIFIGGGLGSVLRFLISHYTHKALHFNGFPLGTFLVNLLGCLLIGFLSSLLAKSDAALRSLLLVGLCGGLTTFSTFSLENLTLWQNQQFLMLSFYILLSILCGIGAVLLGFQLGK